VGAPRRPPALHHEHEPCVGGYVIARDGHDRVAVAQGGTPVTGITTDAFGSLRSAFTPTVGAAEYVGTCSH
jgi:hypothetical protein